MKIADSELGKLLAEIFDEVQEFDDPDEHARRRFDFVFHMLDWKDDLEKLSKLYANPEKYEVNATTLFIIGFLSHVIPHLNAAGRLLLDDTILDPFEE